MSSRIWGCRSNGRERLFIWRVINRLYVYSRHKKNLPIREASFTMPRAFPDKRILRPLSPCCPGLVRPSANTPARISIALKSCRGTLLPGLTSRPIHFKRRKYRRLSNNEVSPTGEGSVVSTTPVAVCKFGNVNRIQRKDSLWVYEFNQRSIW